MLPDLLDATRTLARERGFTGLAVLLLAGTLGATIAVWAIVDAVLLAPVPMEDAGRTVVLWHEDAARGTPVVEVGLGEAAEWAGPGAPLISVAVFTSENVSITVVADGSRSRAAASWISSSFFDVVGTRPMLGRPFDQGDESGDAPRTAIVSHGYWTRVLGADRAAIGRIILMQRGITAPAQPVQIIGVMPRGFDFPGGVDCWLPAAPMLRSVASGVPGDRAEVDDWYINHYRVFYGIGRLRPDVTPAVAAGQIGSIVRLQESSVGTPSGVTATLVRDHLAGPTQPVLWTMLAGAVLMALLACSTVAGLHLYRAANRDRAFAIQLALGAARGRLVRRALLESAIIGIAGAAAALGVAWAMTRLLVSWAPPVAAGLSPPVLTPATIGWVTLSASVTTVLIGLWPAAFLTRIDPGRILTAGVRAAAHPRERHTQRFLVAFQVAVAVVLLSGASLFLRSVQRLDRTPLGFEPDNLIAIELQPSAAGVAPWDVFFDTLVTRAAGHPGVRGAAAVAIRPLSGPIGHDTIPVLKGQEGLGPDAPWRGNPRLNLQVVSPGYFRVIGTRLIAGRVFTAADVAAAPNVVIVGASTAARLWPGRDPVGEPILVATQRNPGELEAPRWQTVVGVVEDVRHRGIVDPRLDVYLPAAQSTIRLRDVLVRTSAPADRVIEDIRAMARELDPDVLAADVVTMTDALARETAPWRFAMRILSGFGVLAALLAAVGLMGLLMLIVTLRRRELAIRAALGASRARLGRDVLREAIAISVVASLVGVSTAAGLARLIAGLLVGVAPNDPLALVGAVATVLALSVTGSMWPAGKAAASDPAAALRE